MKYDLMHAGWLAQVYEAGYRHNDDDDTTNDLACFVTLGQPP